MMLLHWVTTQCNGLCCETTHIQLVNVLIVQLGNNSCGSQDNDFIEFDLLNLSTT